MAPRLFVFVCQTRYSWETLMVIIVSFLPELLEFSEDRHPWESVEEKLHEIRYELLVVCFDHSFVYFSFVLTSLRPYPSPCVPVPFPFSLASQLLSPSLHPFLPVFHLPPSLSRYLIPSSLSLPLPFSPSLPASFPPFLDSLDYLYSCLAAFLFFSLPTPSPLAPHSTNSPMTFHLLTVFLSVVILVLYFPGQLSLFQFLFQRHDAKNGKTDEAWKRMKSLIKWPTHGPSTYGIFQSVTEVI